MTRIGFIGLGDIGLPMARRVLREHGALTVWNRTPARAATLAAEGASVAATPAELMRRCDVVGLCLTADAAVEAVAFGPGGLAAGAGDDSGAGKVVVDFSTGAPDAARRFADRAAALGIGWVDCPVSGGVPAAKSGSLILFAGGEAGHLAAAAALTGPLAARITHLGPAGAGQAAKLCNQMLVACNVLAMAEMIAAARRAGIDVARLPDALAGGFADSKPLQIFGPRMAERRFEPRLGAIGLMAKDLGLARAMAAAAGAATPFADVAHALYAAAADPDADLATAVKLFEGAA